MNRNKISGLDDPENNSEAANKNYVDSENSKQDIALEDKASKSYVDSENSKQDIAIADKASKSYVDTGAIIGDGDRKRATFLVLGLAL